MPQDFFFISWNWPLIRKFCFWGVMSMLVACVCVVITYVTTLPTRCDPPRSWYQGSLIYEIFPGSFKDSNGDGIGDLKGIALKVDYLHKLGVQGIRLNSIFPSNHYPEHFHDIENLTRIEHTLGSIEDFRGLVRALHKKNISIILDIPIHPFLRELSTEDPWAKSTKKPPYQAMTHVIVNNHILNGNLNKTGAEPIVKHAWEEDRGIVTRVLEYWLHENVDGFYIKGLEKYTNDENFISQVQEWRDLLNNFEGDKALICSMKVISELEKDGDISRNPRLTTVLTHFNLIEMYIEKIHQLPDMLSFMMNGALQSNPGYPWVLWSLGGLDTARLASRLPTSNETLAAIALQMMLPGTPSIFYGDEVGLDNIEDYNGEMSDISHTHGLAPMKWSTNKDSRGFTQPVIIPWMREAKAHGPPSGPSVIATLSNIRDSNPSIYMQSVWKEQKINSNCAIRFVDGNLILLERSYPRRNTYVIVTNIGQSFEKKDLSSIFYGGHVLLTQSGKSEDYVKFHNVALNQGEFMLVRLDK